MTTTRILTAIALTFTLSFAGCSLADPADSNDGEADGGLNEPDAGEEMDGGNDDEDGGTTTDTRRPRPRPDANTPSPDVQSEPDATAMADTTPAADTSHPDVTTPTPDATVTPPPPTSLPAPFRSTGRCELEFSTHAAYRFTANQCTTLVGTMTNGVLHGAVTSMSWSAGPRMDGVTNGYTTIRYDSIPVGTYQISVMNPKTCTGASADQWDQYGNLMAPYELRQISAADLAFLQCDWWDANSRTTLQSVYDNNPSCGIQILVDANCNILPGGNMGNYPRQ